MLLYTFYIIYAESEITFSDNYFLQYEKFKQAFEKWKNDWEMMNIEDYLAFYSEGFLSKTSNMRYNEWAQHKTNIFKRDTKLKIEFFDIKTSTEQQKVEIVMYQDYKSGYYHDFGKKKMVWELIDDEWRIINEEWEIANKPENIPPKITLNPQIEVSDIDSIFVKWEVKTGNVPFEYINFLFPSTQKHDDYLLVVEKQQQHAALYKFHEGFKNVDLIKTFRVSTGKVEGNKTKRDDLKTPEGLYFTKEFIPDHKLPAKYGSGAFVLNYPNELDKTLKKTGSGIWIHGSDISMVSFDTEGCVRFENSEIIYFLDELKFDRVPIIINDVVEWTTIDELEIEKAKVLDFFRTWQESWKNQDINSYLSHYTEGFRTNKQKMNYTQWVNHKARIFNPEKPIELELTQIEYYYADNLFLISFYQDYKAQSLISFGKKQIVLKRIGERWFIIQEEWTATPRITTRKIGRSGSHYDYFIHYSFCHLGDSRC